MVQPNIPVTFDSKYTMHGVELEDEMAIAIKEEIDWEILVDILNNTLGWTKVYMERFYSNEHAVDVMDWIAENCKSDVKSRGSTFVFEDAKEAEWFSLRWL